MKQKGQRNLVQLFNTVRDENLHAVRENFQYVYENGGYSLDELGVIFRQTMPAIKWNKSDVRRFLNPDFAEQSGNKVVLLSATPLQITNFLEASIQLRDDIQTELAKAKSMIESARARWGDMADAPPQRDTLLQSIRENFAYVHQRGNYTFEKLAVILKEACPDHSWDKSSARRFIYAEKEHGKKGDVTLISASPESLSRLLIVSIDVRSAVMEALSLKELPSADGPSGPK